MVQKAGDSSVLKTSECQLQECVIKNGIFHLKIVIYPSQEVSGSSQGQMHESIYSTCPSMSCNFRLKRYFVSFMFFEIFKRYEINRTHCILTRVYESFI